MVSGIARRVYPRFVSERAGNDARVIGEHGKVHRLRIVAGLLQRIFFEGRPRLFRVFYLRDISDRHSLPSDLCKGFLKFSDLSLIVRSQYDFFRFHHFESPLGR